MSYSIKLSFFYLYSELSSFICTAAVPFSQMFLPYHFINFVKTCKLAICLGFAVTLTTYKFVYKFNVNSVTGGKCNQVVSALNLMDDSSSMSVVK